MVQNPKMGSRPSARKGGHSLSRSVVLAATATLSLRAALDFTYVNYIDKYFADSLSAGIFALTEISLLQLLESYAIALILSIWLAAFLYRWWRPSGIALLLYFVFVILPLSSLYGLTDAPRSFFYAVAGSFAMLIVVTKRLPQVKAPCPSRDLAYLGLTIVLGIGAYVYGSLLFTEGLGRFSLDLLSVYEVRAEYVQTRTPFLGYFVPWQANIINIFLLIYAVHGRRYWLAGLAIAAQLLLFGMTGHKSFLLAPILAGGVYFLWARKHAFSWMMLGATLAVMVSFATFLVTSDHLVSSLLIRRLFFVPAANHLIYYDFFSRLENPYVMLSNSALGLFVRYPYDVPVPVVIAREYWSREFWPNVGYLGDAFAHLGFMGMFLFSIVLGIFLRVLDSVGSKLPHHVGAAIISVSAMALINSGLFTSLFTHGLALALAMLWLLRRLMGKQR